MATLSTAATVTETFESLRPLLFSIAYRMLGSVAEAEDVVQEAFLRYHRLDDEERSAIESPRAYLSTVATRLAIDGLRSARARRETYVGEWLPEPLLTDRESDVHRVAEDADSLSMAFLLVLERLTPVERAVFLLHDVFDYGYDEVARIVGRTEANCRQLAVRARRHVEEHRPRFRTPPERRDELAARFLDAVGEGDVGGLVELLAADAVVHGDAGGVPPAWPRPIEGRERVGRLLAGLGTHARQIGLSFRRAEVNGQPGALAVTSDGAVAYALSIEFADGAVQTIRAVRNPAKLAHLGRVADLRGLLRGRGHGGVAR